MLIKYAGALNSNLGSLKIIMRRDGTFSGVVQHMQLWLFFAQRITIIDSIVALVHRYNDDMHVRTLHQDTGFVIYTNMQGTVQIDYASSGYNLLACGILISK
jgi:hypothetical protein